MQTETIGESKTCLNLTLHLVRTEHTAATILEQINGYCNGRCETKRLFGGAKRLVYEVLRQDF